MKKQKRKVQKMVSLDGDLIELYTQKYGKGSFSARLNSLLKNFLYISFEDVNSDIVEISSKIEKKQISLSKIRTEIQELEMVREEIEKKAERMNKEKEAQLKLLEEKKSQCLICLKTVPALEKIEAPGGVIHKSCFHSASADVINDVLGYNKKSREEKK